MRTAEVCELGFGTKRPRSKSAGPLGRESTHQLVRARSAAVRNPMPWIWVRVEPLAVTAVRSSFSSSFDDAS
jgi:hypothetical protein